MEPSQTASGEASDQTPAAGAGPRATGPRAMGLDVGDRRIGVALSDELGLTAQPLLTITRSNRRNDLGSLRRILRKHAIAEIVVGNPIHMSGDLSPQAIKAQDFAEMVRGEFGLPVHLWDERLTTTQAHRQLDDIGGAKLARKSLGRKSVIDQVAAVLILQAYLDRRNLADPPGPR